MHQTPLHYQTIADLSALISKKSLSPVDLTRAMLDRIASLDPRLKSYATVTGELAMEQARNAENEIQAGRYRGPLHGIPVAVKDLCRTRGVRTMGGCSVLADHVPDFDATVVQRLREAGAVLLGKLNLTEGAMAGYHPAFAVPENPWKPAHWSGVSSSGSGAATAAGLAYATLGTDTGGSIRHPSAACGVVGLKPTWGRVSRYGVLALAESLDHVGPMARCSADAGIVLQAIAGHDAMDPTSLSNSVPDMLAHVNRGVKGLRIGWDARFARADMAPDFAEAVAQAVSVMEGVGATIVPVNVPQRLRDYLPAWQTLCTAEALDAHRAWYPARAAEYGPFFRQWLERGEAVSGADYAHANTLRAACTGELRSMLRGIDVFACPATPKAAFPVTHDFLYGPIPAARDPWMMRYTVPFNFAGLPSISLPCGLSADGLPLSIQFAGYALSEAELVGVGHAYEQATNWHTLHPPGW